MSNQYVAEVIVRVKGKPRAVTGVGLTKGAACAECNRAVKRTGSKDILKQMTIIAHPED